MGALRNVWKQYKNCYRKVFHSWERIKENCTKPGQEWKDSFLGEELLKRTPVDPWLTSIFRLLLSLALWWPWWHQIIIMNEKKWENMNERQDQVWWIEIICDSETDEVNRTDSVWLTGDCLKSHSLCPNSKVAVSEWVSEWPWSREGIQLPRQIKIPGIAGKYKK